MYIKNLLFIQNDENKKMLKRAFMESGNSINIDKKLQNLLGELASGIKCNN